MDLQLQLVMIAAASLLTTIAAAEGQAVSQWRNLDDTTSSNFPKRISKEAKAVIDGISQALGGNDPAPLLTANPNPPDQPPPVRVNATLQAPWHSIAHPHGATCEVDASSPCDNLFCLYDRRH